MVVFEKSAPPLSELEIKRIERRLGVHLPQDLKEHYLRHNGGRPRLDSSSKMRRHTTSKNSCL